VSTRGKVLAGILAVIVLAVGGFIGYRLLTRDPGESIFAGVPIIGSDPPPECPYTGEEARNDSRSERTAVAVKIENSDAARPQAGLEKADIVYEEEAEGGITRFMAVFQCQDVARIGPVRSARLVDVPLLQQHQQPVFAYSGASTPVLKEIGQTDVVDLNWVDAPDAYEEDPAREAPHQLFTSTRAQYGAARGRGGTPEPLFGYEEDLDRKGSRKANEVHLNFSSFADVFWSYDRRDNVYLRSHGTTPHTLENGDQVSATNLVVLLVRRVPTPFVDAVGNPVSNFDLVGSGRGFVIRDGRAISARWERGSPDEATTLLNRDGEEIALAPGRTWVTLFPTDAPAPPEIS
jgi:Protein of unknown function (DUF3048) N-terminal domain/Protein of unknown function (DUF3048) C-terminal domain